MKIFSDLLRIFFACSVSWASQGLAFHASGGSAEHHQPALFTCPGYPDFRNARLQLSPPRFPFFSLNNASPTSANPSTSLAKQSRSPAIEIQPCESNLQDIETCIRDILNVFLTNKPSIGPACCKAITEMSQDCVSGLFPPFISQLFGPYIKQLCSVPPLHASSFSS